MKILKLFPEKSDPNAETSLEGSGFIDFDKVAIIVIITNYHKTCMSTFI